MACHHRNNFVNEARCGLAHQGFFEFPKAVLGIFHIQDLSSASESHDGILDGSDIMLEDCAGSGEDIFEDVEACPSGENEGIWLRACGESEDDGCFDGCFSQDAVEAPEVESAFEDTVDEAAVEAEVGPPNVMG